MTLAEQIKGCKTPAEAMLLLAQAIDELRQELNERASDPWTEPLAWDEVITQDSEHLDKGPAMTIEGEDEHTVITIRPVSPEKQAARSAFAQEQLMLENLTGLEAEEAYDAYAKGGPLWLHEYDREYVFGLPIHMRMAMVQDLLDEDKRAAHELSADILKNPTPQELGEFLAIRPEIEREANG